VKLAFAAAAAALALAAPAARAQIASDGSGAPVRPLSTADMAALDQAFEAAVQAARASLPVFWGRLAENPGAKADFGLKVTFRNASGGAEQLWLQDIQREGARIVGRLNYDPQSLPNLHRTDIVPIREADIIDWSFKEGRKRYGEFTTRVIAKAHPEDAARTLAPLSDNPLPADARGK
jgi:uncharacterized protein YegJ (DUF2314 family)